MGYIHNQTGTDNIRGVKLCNILASDNPDDSGSMKMSVLRRVPANTLIDDAYIIGWYDDVYPGEIPNPKCSTFQDMIEQSKTLNTTVCVYRKKLKFIHITKCAGTSMEMLSKSASVSYQAIALNDVVDYNRDNSYNGVKRMRLGSMNAGSVYESGLISECKLKWIDRSLLWGMYDTEYEDGIKAAPPPWALPWWHYPMLYMNNKHLDHLLLQYDYFMIMRNPYTRVISEFYCEWSGGPHDKFNYDKYEFNSYISKKLIPLEKEINNLMKLQIINSKFYQSKLEGHYLPQYMYLLRVKSASTSHASIPPCTLFIQSTPDYRNILIPALINSSSAFDVIKDIHILHIENLTKEFNNLMELYEYNDILYMDDNANTSTTSTTKRYESSRYKDSDKANPVIYNQCKRIQQWKSTDLSKENLELIKRVYYFDFLIGNYSIEI